MKDVIIPSPDNLICLSAAEPLKFNPPWAKKRNDPVIEKLMGALDSGVLPKFPRKYESEIGGDGTLTLKATLGGYHPDAESEAQRVLMMVAQQYGRVKGAYADGTSLWIEVDTE